LRFHINGTIKYFSFCFLLFSTVCENIFWIVRIISSPTSYTQELAMILLLLKLGMPAWIQSRIVHFISRYLINWHSKPIESSCMIPSLNYSITFHVPSTASFWFSTNVKWKNQVYLAHSFGDEVQIAWCQILAGWSWAYHNIWYYSRDTCKREGSHGETESQSWGKGQCSYFIMSLMTSNRTLQELPALLSPPLFLAVLGLKLRAYTLNHSTSLFLCVCVMGVSKVGSQELFALVGFNCTPPHLCPRSH
jgi:hypothetical protein